MSVLKDTSIDTIVNGNAIHTETTGAFYEETS